MITVWASQALTGGKEPAHAGDIGKRVRLNPWVGKIPWRRAWQPTPVFLPGESHRQRSLVGYSLQGRKRVGQNWSDLARTCTICRPVASHSGSFSQVQDLKPHPNPCWTKIYIFTRFWLREDFYFDKERCISLRDYINIIFVKDYCREYLFTFGILTFFPSRN